MSGPVNCASSLDQMNQPACNIVTRYRKPQAGHSGLSRNPLAQQDLRFGHIIGERQLNGASDHGLPVFRERSAGARAAWSILNLLVIVVGNSPSSLQPGSSAATLELQTNAVVDCLAQALLAPEIAFRRLHRGVA